MKLYLISKNPMINKLVILGASKLGVEMVESQELDVSINAELVLLDDECFEAEVFEAYKEQNAAVKTILFYSKAAERIEGFDAYIQKPFLPTDLVKTLSEVSGISVEDVSKKSVQSDILELDGGDDLGELNLDEELDFSNLDDLDLEGEKELDLNSSNGELDSEKSAKENAEELPEENKVINSDLQVLDKDDVDAVKDLLGDSKEVVDDTALEFDLDKKSDGITDDAKRIDQELESADQKEERQEAALEIMEKSLDTGDVMDSSLETDDNFDFSLEEIMESDSKDTKTTENVESKAEEDAAEMELDLNDFDLDIGEGNEESKNQESQGVIDAESLGETSLQNENLDNEEVESVESSKKDEGNQVENTSMELSLEDSVDKISPSNIEANSAVDVLDKLEDFSLEKTDEINEDKNVGPNMKEANEVLEEAQEESSEMVLKTDSVDLREDLEIESKVDSVETTNDEFATLSLEEMGEALGEPVQKDPVLVPIISKESSQAQEMQLPSSIQANSLESLIGAIQTLQTQAVKELLSGAVININIQFPKKDEN